jgi:uncharacterized membrane protein YcfT
MNLNCFMSAKIYWHFLKYKVLHDKCKIKYFFSHPGFELLFVLMFSEFGSSFSKMQNILLYQTILWQGSSLARLRSTFASKIELVNKIVRQFLKLDFLDETKTVQFLFWNIASWKQYLIGTYYYFFNSNCLMTAR